MAPTSSPTTTGWKPARVTTRFVAPRSSRGRAFLDAHAPLGQGSHADATGYTVVDGALQVSLGDTATGLADPNQFVGFAGHPHDPTNVVLRKHGLHADIRIDRSDNIGKDDAAGVADIDLESAVSSIMDCEDSVSAVDADDKVVVYGNWLGLMKGDLVSTFQKGDKTMERRLNGDRAYTAADGTELVMQGRACMLVRNVGHHLTTDAVTMHGEPIFETILDCFVTSLAGKHDLLGNSSFRNSRAGSIYIVKPKMHGADEVAWAVELFGRVEAALGLFPTRSRWGLWTRSVEPPSTSPPPSTKPASGSSSSTPASSIAPATRSTPTWKPDRC